MALFEVLAGLPKLRHSQFRRRTVGRLLHLPQNGNYIGNTLRGRDEVGHYGLAQLNVLVERPGGLQGLQSQKGDGGETQQPNYRYRYQQRELGFNG